MNQKQGDEMEPQPTIKDDPPESFDDERDRQPRETRAQKLDRADMLNGRYLGEY